jgi:hypothetical protein
MTMDHRRTDWALDDVDRRTVLVAAFLTAVGALLAMAGLSVACAALVAAGRRWYRRVDLPPNELAKLKWEQARAAVNAGTGAWQETESKSYVPRAARQTAASTEV